MARNKANETVICDHNPTNNGLSSGNVIRIDDKIGAHFKVNCALLGANNDTVILTIQGHKCSELYNIE